MTFVKNLRLKNGNFILDGYPEGATIHGLNFEIGTDLARLFLFRSDLNIVLQWIDEIEKNMISWELRQALAIGATIKFCSCFESTKGDRKRPLKSKSIFSPEDRIRFRSVIVMRNKIVAHDEQVFPANSTMIVLDKDANAIEAVCFGMKFNISDLPAFQDMISLAKISFLWVCTEFENAATTVVHGINMLPVEQRLRVQAGPGFSIKIQDKALE